MPSLTFYIPDQPRRVRKLTYQHPPQFTVDKNGRFHLQRGLVELLNLRAGQHVQIGNDDAAPREWYLKLEPGLGHELLPFPDKRPGFKFASADLRAAILASLPHAPTSELLTFKLETLPVALDDSTEAWPLLTAPYWQPQPPAAERVATKKTLTTAPPGLLGIKQRAILYGH